MKWHIGGKPYLAQQLGCDKEEGRRGFLQLMDPGLGKTATELNNHVDLANDRLVDMLVVVAPNFLKSNWVIESDKWGAGLKWGTWPECKEFTHKHDAMAINYEAILASGGEVLRGLTRKRKIHLVLDECQRVKNHSSAITKELVYDIAKDCRHRSGLTGSPMSKSPEDLYPQLRLAGGLNGTKHTIFKKRFCLTGGFKGRQVKGVQNEDALWKLVDEYGFRAKKEDYLDLPPKTYSPLNVVMNKELQQHYMSMAEGFYVDVGLDDDIVAEMVVSQLIKLQQISSGFVYDSDRNTHTLVPMDRLNKFKALMEVLDSRGNTSKTLVFCHFAPTGAGLVDTIHKITGEKPAYILGGMKTKDVDLQKAMFNDASGPQVMVCQITAGKEGHTLLGDPVKNPCRTTVYYEHNFNLLDRLQSEERNYRIGQLGSVDYIDLISSPVEGVTLGANRAKKSLVDYVVDRIPMIKNPDNGRMAA